MKIETRFEAVELASHVPPNHPKAEVCPICEAERPRDGDWMGVECKATGPARVACHRRRTEARLALAGAGLAGIKARATPPDLASPEIVAAPARGPMRVAPQAETVMTPTGPRTRAVTRDGFHPVALVDAFDLMELQAARRRRKGEEGRPLFTVAQVEAGREYARLRERCLSEGVRGTSLEVLAHQGTGGGSGSWIDGVIQRGRRLERMRAAIGRDVALAPRRATVGRRVGGRVRPVVAGVEEGSGRTITVRELVDAVCCEGVTLSDVLRRRGWSVKGQSRDVLRAALCAALNRLYGL